METDPLFVYPICFWRFKAHGSLQPLYRDATNPSPSTQSTFQREFNQHDYKCYEKRRSPLRRVHQYLIVGPARPMNLLVGSWGPKDVGTTEAGCALPSRRLFCGSAMLFSKNGLVFLRKSSPGQFTACHADIFAIIDAGGGVKRYWEVKFRKKNTTNKLFVFLIWRCNN